MSHGNVERPPSTCGAGTIALITAMITMFGCHKVGHDVCELNAVSQTFAVNVERGTRLTTAGDEIAYSLFIPQRAGHLTTPPYPAVIISHGFARNQRFHHDTACALAQRGIIVLTPNLVSLLGGEQARERNIVNLVDHVRWLRARTQAQSDTLYGLLDRQRLGLVGHSAGGAISIEATIELDQMDEDINALMLLDGVPWTRTLDRAGELQEVAFASARSEPAACNADGSIRQFLARLPFVTSDILVVDASHCDPENPTDLLCRLACGGSRDQARTVYQELIQTFLGDALLIPSANNQSEFAASVERLQATGRIVVTNIETSMPMNSPGNNLRHIE